MPCPGLTVTFIVDIQDVSQKVKAGVVSTMNETEKNKKILENIEQIEKEATKNTGYTTQVKSFYYDNEYYLFLMEKFTDIRLVGFPPNGIGKFGGDTDNWAWPRHTGDFGLFRIYANKDNKPSSFSKENIPYKPKKSFAINIKGIKENDFTMVYGFPGRTTEYLSSDGVAQVMQVLYYYKKWKGELLGLKINNAIEKKKREETQFMNWVKADANRTAKYQHLLEDIQANYKKHEQSIKLNEYINEAIWSSELIKKGVIYTKILQAIDTLKSLDSLVIYQKEMNAFYKSINKNTDYKITQKLYEIYASDIASEPWISVSTIANIYENSFISSIEKFNKLISVEQKEDIKLLILQDPAYQTYHYYDSVQKANMVFLKQQLLQLNAYYSTYILALKEYNQGKQFYPDANSTLRLTYGKVEGVKPQDGMIYTYYTTLDGAVRKHNNLKEEFTLPEKLLKLHENKDYGQYAIVEKGNKTVPLAFLASNHTTGGNSGSPVLNAQGELIGTNFDRIWEGTMSDVLFDPNLCRNITLDIRYTLFIIEKFGGQNG
ncbi:MAG: S46 family peptidase [Bacteroidetes bacterium]|nr:S46 family peptidase [Bacteroidota bacterium]